MVGSYADIQRTLRQAAIGNHAIETGPRAEAEAEGQEVLSLSDLTEWAEAAQRRHDPAAADYLQFAQRRWVRAGAGFGSCPAGGGGVMALFEVYQAPLRRCAGLSLWPPPSTSTEREYPSYPERARKPASGR